MPQLVVFDDDAVVIDTADLTKEELEKEYSGIDDVTVVAVVSLTDTLELIHFPTDRVLLAE